MKLSTALCVAVAAAALAGCGASPHEELPGSPQASSNAVPPEASASSANYERYANSLAKTETGQPLDVNAVVPPVSETELPLPLL